MLTVPGEELVQLLPVHWLISLFLHTKAAELKATISVSLQGKQVEQKQH